MADKLIVGQRVRVKNFMAMNDGISHTIKTQLGRQALIGTIVQVVSVDRWRDNKWIVLIQEDGQRTYWPEIWLDANIGLRSLLTRYREPLGGESISV